MDAIFSVGPILEGVGLNLTAWSYAGGLHIAALGCPQSLPDPWALVDRLPTALGELEIAAARVSTPDRDTVAPNSHRARSEVSVES